MKAFPQKYPVDANEPHHWLDNPLDRGMNLRDYFAAKAMQAYIETADERSICIEEVGGWIAQFSYTVADAMMEFRK